MKRKRKVPNTRSRVRRQRDPLPWKYCVLSAVCGIFLLGGFFFAANFHFQSVDTAMKIHKLKILKSELKNEERKLMIARERAASPNNISKLAENLGFTVTKRSAPVSEIAPRPQLASANKPLHREKTVDRSRRTGNAGTRRPQRSSEAEIIKTSSSEPFVATVSSDALVTRR